MWLCNSRYMLYCWFLPYTASIAPCMSLYNCYCCKFCLLKTRPLLQLQMWERGPMSGYRWSPLLWVSWSVYWLQMWDKTRYCVPTNCIHRHWPFPNVKVTVCYVLRCVVIYRKWCNASVSASKCESYLPKLHCVGVYWRQNWFHVVVVIDVSFKLW